MANDVGNAVVSGIQLGSVWIGVQPALGVEGDPMRLLFDRSPLIFSLCFGSINPLIVAAHVHNITLYRDHAVSQG